MLGRWEALRPQFVRVVPKDYRRVLEALHQAQETGLTGPEAEMAAFEANKRSLARVGGS